MTIGPSGPSGYDISTEQAVAAFESGANVIPIMYEPVRTLVSEAAPEAPRLNSRRGKICGKL
jgi:hypothetical protein